MELDLRLVQAARMLGLGRSKLGLDDARSAIAANPGGFAAALVAESAANDDVTSHEAALDYLESRLAYFSDFIDAPTEVALRSAFASGITNW